MADVKVEDFSLKVIGALDDAVVEYLHEAGSTLQRQAANNTRIGTGETAGKWDYVVDENKGVCTIGNPLQNAIWEEFGKKPVPNKNWAKSVSNFIGIVVLYTYKMKKG